MPIFDGRADNLVEFLDRVANDLGNTSAIIRERSENHNGGWFDTRADDRFWFAYGQLYGYYGILSAAGADFENVVAQRGLTPIWTETIKQLRAALRIQPLHHLQRRRGRLDHADASGDDGLLYPAGALQHRRDARHSRAIRSSA